MHNRQLFLMFLTFFKPLGLLSDEYQEIHRISDEEYNVIVDIRDFLWVFHDAQERLSHSKVPTLPLVLPAYDNVLTLLKEKKAGELKRLSHAIGVAEDKITEYFGKIRVDSPLYAMATSEPFTHMPFPGLRLICAIVIHPAYGWSWISSHWTMEEASCAEAAIKKAVFLVNSGSN